MTGFELEFRPRDADFWSWSVLQGKTECALLRAVPSGDCRDWAWHLSAPPGSPLGSRGERFSYPLPRRYMAVPDPVRRWVQLAVAGWLVESLLDASGSLRSALAASNSLLERELEIYRESRSTPDGLDADDGDLAWLAEVEAAVRANRRTLGIEVQP